MRVRVPEYFTRFKCIADKCLDSCCIGWEIAIDEESREKYALLSSDVGREIAEKTKGGTFPLSEDGRCAFLDGKGLCRIISAHGEGYLCDICREHPRYYGISAYGLEGGLGLGCEEAARLVLSSGGKVDFVYTDRDAKYVSEDAYAQLTDRVREVIYGAIRELDTEELVGALTEFATVCDGIAFNASAGLAAEVPDEIKAHAIEKAEIGERLDAFFDILTRCEALCDEWPRLIAKAKEVEIDELLKERNAVRSLIFYFTHRYVRECTEDMTLGQRILLALLSSLAITALAKAMDSDDANVRAAVFYSKNVEYSTENVDMILDELTEFL